jgi:hypothetical protein
MTADIQQALQFEQLLLAEMLLSWRSLRTARGVHAKLFLSGSFEVAAQAR